MSAAPLSPMSAASDGIATAVDAAAPLSERSPSLVATRRKLRVLILSSDTGGGHRASAQALSAALMAQRPEGVHVDIVDFWVELAGGPFAGFPAQYTFLAKRPWMWKASYELTRFPPARAASEAFFNAFGHQKVREAFMRYEPDLIVSVHPLVNTLSQKVLRKMEMVSGLPQVPYVTVVTDLGGAHPTWFHKRVDMTYVPSEEVRHVGEKVGVAARKMKKFGLPVRQDFWTEAGEKRALREKLGMRPNVRAVLAVGGGDGVGGLKAIAEALAYELGETLGPDDVQLIVVCGKNEKLRKHFEKKIYPLTVIAKGFVSNMSDWMGASDIICTKAGPGTIAESLIRGLPIIVTAFLPGQEEANVDYVVENGVGRFAKEPAKIAGTARRWLADPSLLATMSARAKACGRPQASLEIAADVMEVARAKITENMRMLERQRRLRVVGGRAEVRPHPQQLASSSPQSHLLFRMRFLLRVVLGSMIAQKAFRRGNSSQSSSVSPPGSPRDI